MNYYFITGLIIGFLSSYIIINKLNVIDSILFLILKIKVKKMLAKLDYGSENNFLDTEKLIIDLNTNNLILKSFYSSQKKIEKGVCGELSHHIFFNTPEYLRTYFKMKIVVGSESNFFYSSGHHNFSHTFITLKRKDKSVYIIDSTYKRISLFDQISYEIGVIIKPGNALPEDDLLLEMFNYQYNFFPIKIFDNYLLLFGFKIIDLENYSFTIGLKKRYSKIIKHLYTINVINDTLNTVRLDDNFKELKDKSIKKLVNNLKSKFISLIKNLEIGETKN